MKVLLVAQYGPQSASSRTRVFQYLPHLRDAGIEAETRTVIPDAAIRASGGRGKIGKGIYYIAALVRTWRAAFACALSAGRYDAILVQKVIFPGPAARMLKRHRRKVVFDFDDAIFVTESGGRGVFGRLRGWHRARGLPRMLAAAGQAVVENAYTAEFAERHGAEVTRITGPIDTDRYRPDVGAGGEGSVVGWIGSPTTTPYLDLIRSSLITLAGQFGNLQLRLIGAADYDLPGVAVDSRPWSLETEVRDLGSFDIGLMPLPDDPWTAGKGGYKILQYSAMGLPVVASPVGVNRELVDHGVTGFLAETPEDWVSYLSQLIENPELRRKMGEAGRDKMIRTYSLATASRTIEQVLRSASAR